MPAEKEPFAIEKAIPLLRKAVEPLPKAALFDLYDQGYTSTFEQLLACLISVRTFDEVTVPAAIQLFNLGRTPAEVAKLSVPTIDKAIHACTFHETKAYQIQEIAKQVVEKHGGELPCSFEVMTSFKGIGPKCANLALGIACDKPQGIGVDVHVHRVTNRWGYVKQTTPEKTMVQLQEQLPEKYWVEINKLLVPFGKHICTGTAPHCSTCMLLSMCAQVGVQKHR